MAEAISATQPAPPVDPGRSYAPTAQAGQAPTVVTFQPPADPTDQQEQQQLVPGAVSTAAPTSPEAQVVAQLAGTAANPGPEGRLMQLLRALNPPVPPPIVPASRGVKA